MNLIHKIVADAEKVKAAFLKAMQEVDSVILPEAEKLKPLIETVAQALVPGSGKVVDLAYSWLESTAKALDAGGAAAEANLANAGLDAAAIAEIKLLIPHLKSAAAGIVKP